MSSSGVSQTKLNLARRLHLATLASKAPCKLLKCEVLRNLGLKNKILFFLPLLSTGEIRVTNILLGILIYMNIQRLKRKEGNIILL